jgi:histidine ammonia-lyase
MITPGQATLHDLRAVMGGGALALDPGWRGATQASVDALMRRLSTGEALYGVNTGFGKLAGTRIAPGKLAQLQLNLLRSHAAGTGPFLPAPVVRLVLALKAMSLARGASAVRTEVVEALLALLSHDVLPAIPAKGSVGASGDLAPLAHLSLVLIGEGEAFRGDAVLDGTQALVAAGVAPLALGPKEGLALLNGTQVSTALALAGLFAAQDLLRTALRRGAR